MGHGHPSGSAAGHTASENVGARDRPRRGRNSDELSAHDDAALGPAAIDAARQGSGDREPVAAGVGLVRRIGLPGAPVRTLLAAVLEPKGKAPRPTADPEHAGLLLPVRD